MLKTVRNAAEAEPDDDLARRAAAGDRTAFTGLLDRHYDRIYRLAYRFAGQREDAEDIAQDVCIKLASAVRAYRGEASVTTWLHCIVYTTAIDTLRARRRRPIADGLELESALALAAPAAGPTPEQALGDRQLWRDVQALPPQQRDAVLLVYGEGFSHREAGAVMGCTEATVSWHVMEAKKRLRAVLEDQR